MIVRMFDCMSGDTDLEHPLCEECTESLLEQLNNQLRQYKEEYTLYKYV